MEKGLGTSASMISLRKMVTGTILIAVSIWFPPFAFYLFFGNCDLTQTFVFISTLATSGVGVFFGACQVRDYLDSKSKWL